MPNVLYAGLRNPERDQSIFNALAGKSISEVAELMELQPSTVRAAQKRIADLATYNLTLTGGGEGHSDWACCGQVIPPCGAWRIPPLLRHVPQSGAESVGGH